MIPVRLAFMLIATEPQLALFYRRTKSSIQTTGNHRMAAISEIHGHESDASVAFACRNTLLHTLHTGNAFERYVWRPHDRPNRASCGIVCHKLHKSKTDVVGRLRGDVAPTMPVLSGSPPQICWKQASPPRMLHQKPNE